jgi:hypothetical protein
LFHAEGWAGMTKLILTFCSLANSPKNESDEKLETRTNIVAFNRIGTEQLREARHV